MNAHHPDQLPLFDTDVAGQAALTEPKSVTAAWSSGADLEVHGMVFKFHDDLEAHETLGIALAALGEFHQLPQNKVLQVMSGRKMQEVEPWAVDVPVYVCARDKLDNGVIHVYLVEGELVAELPDGSLWDDCGLGWLTAYQSCCNRNQNNLTPWLGPNCGCTRC